MWVTPTDVEAALLAHPGVAEAGVVGTALEGGLVKAVAFVVPRSAAAGSGLAEALAAHLDARLPSRPAGRGRFTWWTNCHGPPPASSSATSCASGPSNDRWTTPARTTPARPRRGEGDGPSSTPARCRCAGATWTPPASCSIRASTSGTTTAARRSSPRWACRGPRRFRSTGSSACPSWNRAPAFRYEPARYGDTPGHPCDGGLGEGQDVPHGVRDLDRRSTLRGWLEIRAWVKRPTTPAERLQAMAIPDEVARRLRGDAA